MRGLRAALLATAATALAWPACAQSPLVVLSPDGSRPAAAGDAISLQRVQNAGVAKQDADGDVSAQHATPIPGGIAYLLSLLFRQHSVVADWYHHTQDGTDDGPSINAAIADVCSKGTGGTIDVLARTYEIATPVVDATCTIHFHGQGTNEIVPGGGTWFHTSNTAASMLTISGYAARGSEVDGIGFAEDMKTPAAGWAATPYPAAISVQNTLGRVTIRDVAFAPVYDGISSVNSGRLALANISGQPLHTGISVDQSYDTDHFGTIHFWDFWSPDPNVLGWMQANADGLVLGRVDGLTAPDVFVYGYRSAVRFSVSSYGTASRIDFGKVYGDATKYGVWVQSGNDSSSLHASFHISSLSSDGELLGPGSGNALPIPVSAALLIDTGARADATIDHIETQFHNTSPVQINSTLAYSVVRIGMINSVAFNVANNSSPAIQVSASSNATFPHDVELGMLPNLLPSYSAPLINTGTDTLFDWPGFSRSGINYTPSSPVNNAAYGTPDYTRSVTVTPGSARTATGVVWQLPAHPRDGQPALFVDSQPLSGLSVVPSPSGSTYPVAGQPPASLPANTLVSYRFSAASQFWLLGGQ